MGIIERYSLLVAILATIVGVFSIILAYIGYWKFKQADKLVEKKLKAKMQDFEMQLDDKLVLIQNANSKIQASYNTDDADAKLDLLHQAEEICPKAYNLYNSIGYAYLTKNQKFEAIKAFETAIKIRPKDIAGYNDIINLYTKYNDKKLVDKYFKQASKIDKDAKEKIKIVNL